MKKTLTVLLLSLSLNTFAGSWQAMVDDQLIGSGMCNAAAIYDFNGNTYAQKNMRINAHEANILTGFYNNPAEAIALGLHVEGVHYVTRKANNSTLAGTNSQNFVWISKTYSLSVICKGNVQNIGQGGSVTDKLAQYLMDRGF